MTRSALLALLSLLLLACAPADDGAGGTGDGDGDGTVDGTGSGDGDGDGTGDGDGDGVCQPGSTTCVDDTVYDCGDDGQPGNPVETCEVDCVNGFCVGDPDGGGDGDDDACDSNASGFVYVVDNANNLYRFDPANGALTFTSIGRLNCPAGPPITTGGGPATPFSMSVDRDATAWVLYSSGEIFYVSTEDASCSASGFVKQQNGYDLMGMGFVSDASDSAAEKLFVAGSTIDPFSGGFENTKLGFISPDSLVVSHLTDVNGIENPPELTGTGDARLYGYFPGRSSTISELDQATGQRVPGREWPAGSIAGNEDLLAWAFAQWGGQFYVFVTTQAGLFGSPQSKVIQVDPAANGGAGSATTVKTSDVPYIVGAGVSTCAPIIID